MVKHKKVSSSKTGSSVKVKRLNTSKPGQSTNRDANARLKVKETIRLKEEYVVKYCEAQQMAAIAERKLNLINKFNKYLLDNGLSLESGTGSDKIHAYWLTICETDSGVPKSHKEVYWEAMRAKRVYIDRLRVLTQLKSDLKKNGMTDLQFAQLEKEYGLK